MLPRRFIVAIVNEEGDHVSAFSMTRARVVGTVVAAAAVGFGLLFMAVVPRIQSRGKGQSREMAVKNEALVNAFKTWETRVQKLETELKDVQRRNRQLRTTAFLSLPEVEYGIGGPESSLSAGFFDFSEMQPIEWDLNKIETQVKALEQSTTELETTIAKKQREIAHYPSIQPVRGGWLSSSFGKRVDPFTGKIEDHPGIDISIRPGTEVYASGAGVVKEINTRVITNKGYGIYIVIDHGFGYETLYAHLSKAFVRKGQQVKRWDLIGLTGDTGKSTAPHLHYSVTVNGEWKNPMHFLLE
jgi:murein DD-endopeptidase MepM/ murein hydrolase activator NlpD